MSDGCPTTLSLRRMLAGDAAEPNSPAVERHVSHCAACQATIEGILAEDAPAFSPSDRDGPESAVTYLERLRESLPGLLEKTPAASGAGGSQGEAGHGGRPQLVFSPPELPGYELLDELGRGGMGVVYKARQLGLNRVVALKMILGGPHAGTQTEARFRAEAEAVARLQHPNIVLIYHVAEHDGRPFLEMEYLEGGSLADRLRGEPMAARDAAILVESLARAMAAAHRAGILHRDLKPANILLSGDGTPKVADFGLAKLLDADSAMTQTDAIMGSPSYMAPEQAEGKSRELGPGVDIHALGSILYEALSGRPPFRGATVSETLEQVRSTEPVPPSRLVPRLPRDLETIALKCLEKAPARRYGSARDLADDLRRYLEGRPVLARRATSLERAAKWARRRPAIAVLSLLALATTLLLIAGGFYYNARLRGSNHDLTDALARARKAELDAAASARSAGEQRDLALKTLNTLVFEVQEKLGKAPATRPLQQALLDEAIKGLGELAGNTASAAPDQSRAEAHLKLASVYEKIGRLQECRDQLDQTIEICDRLVASGVPTITTRTIEAKALLRLGIQTLNSDRPDEALALFSKGLSVVEPVQSREAEAEGAHTVEMKLVDRIAAAHLWKNDQKTARAFSERHHRMVSEWAASRPQDPGAHFLVANSLLSLSRLDKSQGNQQGALARLTRCEEICRQVLSAAPADEMTRDSLHVALNNHAVILYHQGDFAGSLLRLEEARRLFLEVESSDPDNRSPQLRLAQVEYSLGHQLASRERFTEAERILCTARERLTRLDRAGNLEDQQSIKGSVLPAIESILQFSEAAQRVVDKPDVVSGLAPAQAAPLLAIRVARLASREGLSAELLATVRRVCNLEARQPEDLLAQASACVKCVKVMDAFRGDRPVTPEVEEARRLCQQRAQAGVVELCSRGSAELNTLEQDIEYKELRDDRAIHALIARHKEKKRER